MADTFKLEIVTPSRKILSKDVEEVTATGQEGEFGVLAGHTPFLTVLKAGEISYKKGSEVGYIASARGYAEVLPDKTTILVDAAVLGSEVDAEAAKKLQASAEEKLRGLTNEAPEYQKTTDDLDFAEAQLRIKDKR